MSRSSGYYSAQPGSWDTTSTDYHSHVSKMMRMPSVLTGVPQYPTVHKMFTNKPAAMNEQPEDRNSPRRPEEAKKKVQFAEVQEQTAKEAGDPREAANNYEVETSSGELEAKSDSFIRNQHRRFELCKWTTFKA